MGISDVTDKCFHANVSIRCILAVQCYMDINFVYSFGCMCLRQFLIIGVCLGDYVAFMGKDAYRLVFTLGKVTCHKRSEVKKPFKYTVVKFASFCAFWVHQSLEKYSLLQHSRLLGLDVMNCKHTPNCWL